ncbi:hypothetical protein [Cloacibacterium sp. TD35]|uniref:hypothetical protein n=1 Tax=Cloacibacterium sp. TD35 TaxID=2976818 RepID=UPI00237E923C|nr:hypothetical protein [Cloacibacterium sp. TD35]WDT66938.1 hypothetical protein N7277_06230 [Cloacibacterium sp. TD35]
MKNNFKKLALIAFIAISMATNAQTGRVGINTTTPNTTLDVTGKLGATDTDGMQVPRLTRAQLTAKGTLYTAAQTGAQVYITDVSAGDNAGPRANITATGLYYFDGTL